MFLKNNYLGAVILVFTTVALVVSSQSLWKYKLLQLQENNLSLLAKYIELAKSPIFWIGMLGYIIATIMWIYILSIYDFSLVHPLNSMGYILALLIGHFFFYEKVGLNRIAGVIAIIIGIIILTRR